MLVLCGGETSNGDTVPKLRLAYISTTLFCSVSEHYPCKLKYTYRYATFIVHVPLVLPDGVVVRAGRRPGGEVGGHAAHNRPLRLWRGNPTARRTDLAARAKRPERRVVEVVGGADQRGHLDGVDFLVVGFEALGLTGLEIAAGDKRDVSVSAKY